MTGTWKRMTDSLRQESSNLGLVRLRHIATLIDLLRSSTITQKDHVRRRYCEQASQFDATLQFVTQLGYVQVDGESLSLRTGVADSSFDVKGISQELLGRMCAPASPFRTEVCQYLG